MWSMSDEDGKADCKKVEFDDLDLEMETAQSCPVNVIHIIDKETGEKLI